MLNSSEQTLATTTVWFLLMSGVAAQTGGRNNAIENRKEGPWQLVDSRQSIVDSKKDTHYGLLAIGYGLEERARGEVASDSVFVMSALLLAIALILSALLVSSKSTKLWFILGFAGFISAGFAFPGLIAELGKKPKLSDKQIVLSEDLSPGQRTVFQRFQELVMPLTTKEEEIIVMVRLAIENTIDLIDYTEAEQNPDRAITLHNGLWNNELLKVITTENMREVEIILDELYPSGNYLFGKEPGAQMVTFDNSPFHYMLLKKGMFDRPSTLLALYVHEYAGHYQTPGYSNQEEASAYGVEVLYLSSMQERKDEIISRAIKFGASEFQIEWLKQALEEATLNKEIDYANRQMWWIYDLMRLENNSSNNIKDNSNSYSVSVPASDFSFVGDYASDGRSLEEVLAWREGLDEANMRRPQLREIEILSEHQDRLQQLLVQIAAMSGAMRLIGLNIVEWEEKIWPRDIITLNINRRVKIVTTGLDFGAAIIPDETGNAREILFAESLFSNQDGIAIIDHELLALQGGVNHDEVLRIQQWLSNAVSYYGDIASLDGAADVVNKLGDSILDSSASVDKSQDQSTNSAVVIGVALIVLLLIGLRVVRAVQIRRTNIYNIIKSNLDVVDYDINEAKKELNRDLPSSISRLVDMRRSHYTSKIERLEERRRRIKQIKYDSINNFVRSLQEIAPGEMRLFSEINPEVMEIVAEGAGRFMHVSYNPEFIFGLPQDSWVWGLFGHNNAVPAGFHYRLTDRKISQSIIFVEIEENQSMLNILDTLFHELDHSDVGSITVAKDSHEYALYRMVHEVHAVKSAQAYVAEIALGNEQIQREIDQRFESLNDANRQDIEIHGRLVGKAGKNRAILEATSYVYPLEMQLYKNLINLSSDPRTTIETHKAINYFAVSGDSARLRTIDAVAEIWQLLLDFTTEIGGPTNHSRPYYKMRLLNKALAEEENRTKALEAGLVLARSKIWEDTDISFANGFSDEIIDSQNKYRYRILKILFRDIISGQVPIDADIREIYRERLERLLNIMAEEGIQVVVTYYERRARDEGDSNSLVLAGAGIFILAVISWLAIRVGALRLLKFALTSSVLVLASFAVSINGRAEETKDSYNISVSDIEDADQTDANDQKPFNWRDFAVVFAKAKPHLNLQNAQVIVIGEDHFTQLGDQFKLVQLIGSAREVLIYKEGVDVGDTINFKREYADGSLFKQDGKPVLYTAHGIEAPGLNWKAAGEGAPVDLALSKYFESEGEEKNRAEKDLINAVRKHHEIQVLRDMVAAKRVALGFSIADEKQMKKVVIMGLDHVIGAHTPTLLPELSKYGIDWIAVVPSRVLEPNFLSFSGDIEATGEFLSNPTRPRVLTADNFGPLYRLYYELGRVSDYYDPYAGDRKFPFEIEPITIENNPYDHPELWNRLKPEANSNAIQSEIVALVIGLIIGMLLSRWLSTIATSFEKPVKQNRQNRYTYKTNHGIRTIIWAGLFAVIWFSLLPFLKPYFPIISVITGALAIFWFAVAMPIVTLAIARFAIKKPLRVVIAPYLFDTEESELLKEYTNNKYQKYYVALFLASMAGLIFLATVAGVTNGLSQGVDPEIFKLIHTDRLLIAVRHIGLFLLGMFVVIGHYINVSSAPRHHNTDNSQLITDGLYSYLRHPIYFSWSMVLIGLLMALPLPFIVLPVTTGLIALVYGVVFENVNLWVSYGKEYSDYAKKAPMVHERLIGLISKLDIRKDENNNVSIIVIGIVLAVVFVLAVASFSSLDAGRASQVFNRAARTLASGTPRQRLMALNLLISRYPVSTPELKRKIEKLLEKSSYSPGEIDRIISGQLIDFNSQARTSLRQLINKVKQSRNQARDGLRGNESNASGFLQLVLFSLITVPVIFAGIFGVSGFDDAERLNVLKEWLRKFRQKQEAITPVHESTGTDNDMTKRRLRQDEDTVEISPQAQRLFDENELFKQSSPDSKPVQVQPLRTAENTDLGGVETFPVYGDIVLNRNTNQGVLLTGYPYTGKTYISSRLAFKYADNWQWIRSDNMPDDYLAGFIEGDRLIAAVNASMGDFLMSNPSGLLVPISHIVYLYTKGEEPSNPLSAAVTVAILEGLGSDQFGVRKRLAVSYQRRIIPIYVPLDQRPAVYDQALARINALNNKSGVSESKALIIIFTAIALSSLWLAINLIRIKNKAIAERREHKSNLKYYLNKAPQYYAARRVFREGDDDVIHSALD
ncbi:MAG: isoprenylcysteine carboxylmethyltransferase family protein, partial [Candidatus Omnitrophica bacterium]|nr:isoprenylcysteine carboxylmethyltransferase family protein [Candidatus Omnitrophota bacterium]